MRRAARQTAQPTRHGLARSLCAVAQLAKTVPLPNISPVSLAARQISQGPSRTDPVHRREFGLTNAPLRCRSRQGENEATWWSPPTIWPGLRGPVNSPQITDCLHADFHIAAGRIAEDRRLRARLRAATRWPRRGARSSCCQCGHQDPGCSVRLGKPVGKFADRLAAGPVLVLSSEAGGLTTPAMWPEPAITILDVAAEILRAEEHRSRRRDMVFARRRGCRPGW